MACRPLGSDRQACLNQVSKKAGRPYNRMAIRQAGRLSGKEKINWTNGKTGKKLEADKYADRQSKRQAGRY
jgi:hypothetical protein